MEKRKKAKNNKVTFKEFVKAIPRLADILFWGFACFCVIAGMIVMATLILVLFSWKLMPELTETTIMLFGEWVKSNNTFSLVLFGIAFFVGVILFIRKLTIDIAKDVQRSELSEV